MNKKGGMTAKQIITLVILIVSFVILVIFFFALNIRSMMTENVCTNSLVWKTIPLGGYMTSISCESQDVCITLGEGCLGLREGAIDIRVKDNGPGVAKVNRDKIFDPLFTTRAADGGTGVGLSLAKSHIEKLGGELNYVPMKKGACFEIRLSA